MSFEIHAEDGNARTGVLHTPKRSIETPFFMPVATKGAIKYLPFNSTNLLDTKLHSIISNAMLLYLTNGLPAIKRAGGLHNYYNVDHGIFTDSGGFQLLRGSFKPQVTDAGFSYINPFNKKR